MRTRDTEVTGSGEVSLKYSNDLGDSEGHVERLRGCLGALEYVHDVLVTRFADRDVFGHGEDVRVIDHGGNTGVHARAHVLEH